VHMWRPDSDAGQQARHWTLEEVEAIVDEAHRLGLKVACHTYGGEHAQLLGAGSDSPNHLLDARRTRGQSCCRRSLYFVPTIDDLISLRGGLRETAGRNSRLRLMEQAFKKGA